jgi:hypothetical protein
MTAPTPGGEGLRVVGAVALSGGKAKENQERLCFNSYNPHKFGYLFVYNLCYISWVIPTGVVLSDF